MIFTIDELLKAGNHKWKKSEVDSVTLRNLDELCRRVNALGYSPAMRASSCLRSLADQKRINPSAMGSSHLYGCAVDVADPTGDFARWVRSHTSKLVECGLWCENPQYTKGWVHLAIYMPKSGNRFFNP